MALTGDAARVAKLAQSLGASKSKAEGAVSSVLAKSSGGGSSSKPGAGVPANTASDVQWLANQGFLTDNSAAGVQKAISVANLAKETPTPIVVPPVPETPYTPIVPITPTPTPELTTAQDTATKTFQDYISELTKNEEGQASLESQYAKAEKDAGIAQKQQLVNDYTLQQNQIIAQQQADILQARNQSSVEGGTAGILSAREDAINRSAAIKLLLIQAQLAAAQDNLEYAQERMGTLFDLKIKDAQNKYEFKNKLLDATYSFMSAQQKELADDIRQQNDNEFTLKRDKLNYLRESVMTAYKDGNTGLAAALSRIDENSSTVDADIASAFKNYGGTSGGGNGADAPLYAGLTAQTATAVRGQVSAFKTEPTVQNFAVVQEGRNFANSIDTKTTNPADDQALIYALAKALDPNSVVREGEYATAQKYAQSWVKAYGKGVTQAIAGTGFLSEEARKNIKSTIETKYNSSRASYDNLYGQYEKGINNLTGRTNGKDFLRDYVIPEAVKEPETKEEASFLDTVNNTGGYWSNLWKSIIGK